MWQPGIGPAKVVLMLLVLCLLWLPGSFANHLARGIVVCFAFAMVVTPGDLFSPLIVGIPLSVAFVGGVLFAPGIRSTAKERRTEPGK